MAEFTYTVTVASGNLYGGGTGNVFYLNGARNSTGPGTVSWVQGGTLRFDQSDNTNDGHPLIFSTTTSRDQYLTSGVTYYLDGASNYSNYTNVTTFNAATTRYVEITPSSQTDFYYLCYVHGIGMGGIFDITSTTWGALSWGEELWGESGNMDVSVSGISIASSIGSLQSVSGGVDQNATGQTLNFSQGTTVGGTSVLIENPGPLTASVGIGQVVIGIGAGASGLEITSSSGAVTIDESILTGEGWGRAAWGEFAWGVNFSVALTGQQLTSSIGEEAAITDVTVQVSGSSLTSTFGNYSILSDVGITVFAAEDQLDFTIGSLSFDADANVTVTSAGSLTGSVGNTIAGLKTPVDVTGIQMTSSLGTINLVQNTVETVSGQSIAMSLGQHSELPGQLIGVSGLQFSGSIGQVTVEATAGIDVSGIQMTASVGSPNITAWSEINPGVSNTWSPVDLAA